MNEKYQRGAVTGEVGSYKRFSSRWRWTNSLIGELVPVWVERIPDELEEGMLYINANGRTLRHLCPCGCGETITTSLHPKGWFMLFDGVSVTLDPSIGNPHLRCKSHYYIVRNQVIWCEPPAS